MRAPIWLLFASCGIAVVVPYKDSSSSDRHETRADPAAQTLENPDGEPPYTDATSGDQIEKSRILTNLGPDAARQRYFDWDESCTDVGQRERIVQAYIAMQPLVKDSSQRLQDLKSRLPSQPVGTKGNTNLENQIFIQDEDPAYTQMFNARDIGIQYVADSYDLITNNIDNFPGRGGSKPAALRFICNADNHVKAGNENPLCGSGDTASQAETIVPQRSWDLAIEQKYRFSTSTSIVFCPTFFDDSKYPNIYRTWTDISLTPTLKQVDCRERILIHEYMHVPWVRNMAPNPDYSGVFKVADVAATLGWNKNKATPDCYAWYTIYSAYNNEHQGCGRDIWPADVDKPVKISE